SDPPPGDPRGTEAHPFDDIQEAIDVARDGYTILVRPGQYLEPDPLDPQGLIFSGGNIRLTSIDPTDSNVVKNTVIRGFVQFDGTEDPNCTLRGFTIRNVAHGRIYGNHTHATISHCIISGNAPCWATVIENCHGTISNCVITDNFTIYLCGVEPVVLDCHGLIKNCTIANNASEIGVFAGGTTTLENCIIYYNGDQVELEPQIRVGSDATLNISYCDLQGHLIGISGEGSATIDIGPGIIDVDPCFVRPGSWDFNAVPDGLVEGDYHLKSAGWRWDPNETYWTYDDVTSRCIDAGNPGAPLGNELMKVLPDDPNNDFGVNLRINMGAYGGTAEASMALPGSVLLADLNNDGIVDTPDLGWQLADWLKSESEQPGDLNRDGFVDMLDYAMLAEAWMWSTDWADQPP
ncbi:MAG: right-handed parallel beta-helix repeat-containing protein, partial [Planctomycetota bacterium]